MTDFMDDSSTALGLSHGVGVPRDVREHEDALLAAGIKTPSDEQRVTPRNDGAGKSLADRMQKYLDVGYSTLEAATLAEQEPDEPAKAEDYMGASTEELMRAAVSPEKHGGRSSGKKRGPKIKPLFSAVDRASMGNVEDDIPKNETEMQKAERLACEAQRRAELQIVRGPGAPLKGKEPRMRIQGRMEPSKVLSLHNLTGRNCVEILEEVDSLLQLAKSGATKEAVIESVMRMIEPHSAEDVA